MSTCLSDDNDPTGDFEGPDDGVDDDLDSVSEFRPSSTSAVLTSGSKILTADSQISVPSGLPLDTIARLTHDELCHNPKFMRHVNLVDALLLNVQSPSTSKFSPSPLSCRLHALILFPHSCPFVPGSDQRGFTGLRWSWHVITSHHLSTVRAPRQVPKVNPLEHQ
jgi:hypothetical protein